MITPATFRFLSELKDHNNREWFEANKPRYQAGQKEVLAFGKALAAEMAKHDELEPPQVFRIYRDVRFSKDKTPYKTHLSGSFTRVGKQRRGGYYFHIMPGGSFIGGGFWAPESKDLKRIRQEIAHDPDELRSIITTAEFRSHFGELQGDQLKTAPQGYAKDHPAIDLLRYKQFLLMRPFSDEEVMAPSFLQQADATFQAMRPLFDYMSEVLTTDENGVPIV